MRLHFPVLRALGLDKVLAVGAHGLQPDEEVAKVLGNPRVGLLGVARAALEVVDPFHVRSQLRFRSK